MGGGGKKKWKAKKNGQGKNREFTRARDRAAFCRAEGGGHFALFRHCYA